LINGFWETVLVFLSVEQMLTASVDRYESILAEVPVEYKQNLVQVTKYQDGQYCPVNSFFLKTLIFIFILCVWLFSLIVYYYFPIGRKSTAPISFFHFFAHKP
jgi:hypothetical protein